MGTIQDLLLGIGAGYARRGQEIEKEEFDRGQAAQQFGLDALMRMAPDVTPETRPILYQNVFDLLKVKGEPRKFLDLIAGVPDTSVSRQVGDITSRTFQAMIPEDEYQRRRAGALTAKPGSRTVPVGTTQMPGREVLPAQFQVAQPSFGRTPGEDMRGKIALRQPLREQEALYKSKAYTDISNKMNYLEEQQRLTQQGRLDLETEKAKNKTAQLKLQNDMKAEFALNSRAVLIATKRRGFKTSIEDVMPGDLQQAAADLFRDATVSTEVKEATRQYLAERGYLARMLGQQAAAGTNPRQLAEKRYELGVQDRVRQEMQKYTNASADVARLETELTAAKKLVTDLIAEGFTPTTSKVIKAEVEVRKLEGELRSAQKLQSDSNDSLRNTFKNYIRKDEQGRPSLAMPSPGTAPGGLPLITPPPPAEMPPEGVLRLAPGTSEADRRKVEELLRSGKQSIR